MATRRPTPATAHTCTWLAASGGAFAAARMNTSSLPGTVLEPAGLSPQEAAAQAQSAAPRSVGIRRIRMAYVGVGAGDLGRPTFRASGEPRGNPRGCSTSPSRRLFRSGTDVSFRNILVRPLQQPVEARARDPQRLGGGALVPLHPLHHGEGGAPLDLRQRRGEGDGPPASPPLRRRRPGGEEVRRVEPAVA